MKIAICEDTKQDYFSLYKMLKSYLTNEGIKCRIDVFNCGEDFLTHIEQTHVIYNLIFLDIYMKEVNGVELAKKIRENDETVQIVFTTTSKEFCTESYAVDAFYYLIKPITKEQIDTVLNKYFKKFINIRTIEVKCNRKMMKFAMADIYYIESSNKKCIIHTSIGDYETRTSIAEFETLLPSIAFYKPIRYALVSFKYVKCIDDRKLILNNNFEIPISEKELKNIQQAFIRYKWKSIESI